MKTAKRFLLIFLALTMLASALLVGCKKKEETDEDEDGVVETEETYETDEWGQRIYSTGIPDELDYDGDQIDILIPTHDFANPRRYEWYAQTFEGDSLNTAVFYRNETIKEELGIELNFPEAKEGDDINNYITNNYKAGVGGVDIVANKHFNNTSPTLMECYKNLMHEDFTYLHLDHPYWNQNFINTAKANDRLFVVVGDMTLSCYMTTFTMLFNKTLLNDIHRMSDEDLYAKVLNGEWTWDYLTELCLNTHSDIDSVSGKSEGDIFGYTSHSDSHAYDGYLAAFDMSVTTVDAEGNHKLIDSSYIDTLGSAADKLAKFYMTDDVYLVGYKSASYVQPVASFKKGLSLFCTSGMGDVVHLTEMTDEYGLLPMPKYTTEQENYYGGVQDSHNSISVMYHAAQDYEQISAVLELFASKSYSSVRPTLFEKVVKGKYLKDASSVQVFDIILAGTKWDFSDIYPLATKSVRNTLWRGAIYRAVFGDSGTGSGDAKGAMMGRYAGNSKEIKDALKTHDEWLYTHY